MNIYFDYDNSAEYVLKYDTKNKIQNIFLNTD